ncbi:MAG: serine--tRNA ligase [Pseudomonadota bacterium]
MFDLKWLRENPDAFDAGLKRRGSEPAAARIIALDKEARAATAEMNEVQTARNAKSKEIGAAKAKGDDEAFRSLMAAVDDLKQKLPLLEAAEKEHREALNAALSALPNLPDDAAPDGLDEDDNVEIRTWGDPLTLDPAQEHYELGEALGQMDFEAAARMSGARFVILRKDLARLERAIASFMLDTHTNEFDYEEVSPPLLVRDDALFGVGQLPKFADDLFRSTGDHWLIPTAEASLTNIVREQIIPEDALPLRMTAHTPCFRSEAGAAGRDTRGMIRLHQFNKVELVSVTTPQQSVEEHERMTACAEAILQRLDIAYRTVILCTGDMGFSARKTYDIEAWLPGQGRYREISSCSNCGDFQARRMNARYRPSGEKSARFVHTLNGSGLAVGRTLVAILETYQQTDGSIIVPDALKCYMGGVEKIERAQ